MKDELVDLSTVREEFVKAGRSIKHLTRNIRKAGFVLHKVRGLSGRSKYALVKQDAEKYLALFENSVPEETVSGRNKFDVEEQVRQNRVNDGWISLKLSAAGMPDLINIRSKGDGSFEILFEEVKGPGDGIRKEQHSVIEEMKQDGIPVVVTWV